jgi:aryl-alcohol dehydrogenase-like predicted oxidoreductase
MAAIGLGLAALGRPGYLTVAHGADLGEDRSVEALRRHAHAVLDAARELGVRHVDAARSYGRAEEFLAAWLSSRALTRDDVVVSSKWGYTYTADWRVDADPPEVKDLSVEAFRRQLAETRALLGDWLSLYQIHSATVSSGVLDDPELRAELAALRDGGVRVGLSVTGPEQAATIDRALEVGGFDSVQATWNLHERAAEDALERAHAAGLTVMVKEALANGRLADRADIAFRAALARPWADIVLSGAATVEQLRANVAAAAPPWDDRLERELASLRESSDAYWDTRSRLSWT